ncbi:hypothetical protein KOR34_30160 [Posidoniimonas corsicana]|uniref:Pentapeptide repeats (8 copies) n=1 Tax=Posidoniimonas corsicana TaxID=1938618 RepID=A0A5C5VHG0_9BACT|nr:hypothetical protein [Posidoniimonas corsicana]TWT38048.1 hypothetical protein KOR34_30160 [Posidoniimonas corsicana]
MYLQGDLSGWDLSSQNLTWSTIYGDNLNGLDLTGADLRSARFLDRVTYDEVRAATITDNAISPDGRVDGLHVQNGGSMRVSDFNPYRDDHLFLRGEHEVWRPGPTAILVGEELAAAPQGELRLEFADPVWESTITFEPGIPVTLAGTLNLSLTAASAPRSLVGSTYRLFDWSGVAPTGGFDRVVSDHGAVWDLDRLYTTGEVTLLTAAPEPAGWLIAAGALWLFTARARGRVRGPGMCTLKPTSSL